MFIVNVEGAIFHEGKWLLIKRGQNEDHAPGALSLIGGKVDIEGATYDILEKTLKREVFEEVGVTIKDEMKYVYSSSFIADDHTAVINIVFLCEIEQGEPYQKSSEEVEEILWLSTDEVLGRIESPPWLKESITRANKLLNKD